MPFWTGCIEDNLAALQPHKVLRGARGWELEIAFNTWDPARPEPWITVAVAPRELDQLSRVPADCYILQETADDEARDWCRRHKVPLVAQGGMTPATLRKLMAKAGLDAAQCQLMLRYLTDDECGTVVKYVPKVAVIQLFNTLGLSGGLAKLEALAADTRPGVDARSFLSTLGTTTPLAMVRHVQGTDNHALHKFLRAAFMGIDDERAQRRLTRLDQLYDAVYERKLLSHKVAWLRFCYEEWRCSQSSRGSSNSPALTFPP